jgi:hypothetical protein
MLGRLRKLYDIYYSPETKTFPVIDSLVKFLNENLETLERMYLEAKAKDELDALAKDENKKK